VLLSLKHIEYVRCSQVLGRLSLEGLLGEDFGYRVAPSLVTFEDTLRNALNTSIYLNRGSF